jgi:hypothetical protein
MFYRVTSYTIATILLATNAIELQTEWPKLFNRESIKNALDSVSNKVDSVADSVIDKIN